jgi:hypothetical protein
MIAATTLPLMMILRRHFRCFQTLIAAIFAIVADDYFSGCLIDADFASYFARFSPFARVRRHECRSSSAALARKSGAMLPRDTRDCRAAQPAPYVESMRVRKDTFEAQACARTAARRAARSSERAMAPRARARVRAVPQID